MRGEARPFVNILPAKKNEILLENEVDLRLREFFADGSAMLVEHHAARLVEHFPTTFPGQIAEICVLQVKWPQNLVEASQLEKLALVKGARATSTVKARIQILDRRVIAMADA